MPPVESRIVKLPAKIAMAVHGGAFDIPAEDHRAYRHGCEAALTIGWQILSAGGSAIAAVEAAVRSLEDSGTFDAGRGSFLNELGQVRLDAGIMDGRSLATGSVADVLGVPNAITLARRVMESPLAVVVGPGAHEFAVRSGVPTCPPAEMVSDREMTRWKETGGRQADTWAGTMFGDTVGAVARDASGDLAAATSTGGSPNKPAGRVGDSPFIGAGLYADNESAAVSATGHGELIIPLVWSKAAADLAGSGMAAQASADRAIELLARTGARAGMILVDRSGNLGIAWNTPTMAFAGKTAKSAIMVSGPDPSADRGAIQR